MHTTLRGLVIGTVVSIAAAGSASAAIETYRLFNHPDGNQAPPTYGLRLDNLFTQAPSSGSVNGGQSGVTTFSFDPADGADMRMVIDTNGADPTIRIFGTAYGGRDAGGDYGFGEGFYSIDFTYAFNVQAVNGINGGFRVSPNSVENRGSITALAGNSDLNAGTSWEFYDKVDNNNNSFRVLRDNHRLPGNSPLRDNVMVGVGWVTFDPQGGNLAGVQDFIFVTPEPASLLSLLVAAPLLLRRR